MNKQIVKYTLITALLINFVYAKEIIKPVIPSYKLTVGKKLFYTAQSEFTGTKFSAGSQAHTQFWVWQKNQDGSYRIIVSQHISSYRILDDSTRKDDAPQTKWAYFDIFSDGGIIKNVSLNNFNPALYFIPLPFDTQIARSGWSRYDSVGNEQTYYSLKNQTLADNLWQIEMNKATPFDSIYLMSSRAQFFLDKKQGLVTKKETELTSGYGYSAGKSAGLTTLDSIRPLDTTGLKPFVNDLIAYYQAVSEYSLILDKVEYNSPEVNITMSNARDILIQASQVIKDTSVQAMLNEDLAGHEQIKTSIAEDSIWFAQTLNKKAVEWKLKDLAGKYHTSKQYRGKIVILDFWYRGCPWCIRAMPSLNRLAQEYKNSVVVLGMNIDKDINDALLVQDKMQLVYPSLQCGDVYKKYGVSGFPTLFVIDKKGVIRDIHIGYAPDLYQKLTTKIQTLLAKK